jgi:hypothetical protein
VNKNVHSCLHILENVAAQQKASYETRRLTLNTPPLEHGIVARLSMTFDDAKIHARKDISSPPPPQEEEGHTLLSYELVRLFQPGRVKSKAARFI